MPLLCPKSACYWHTWHRHNNILHSTKENVRQLVNLALGNQNGDLKDDKTLPRVERSSRVEWHLVTPSRTYICSIIDRKQSAALKVVVNKYSGLTISDSLCEGFCTEACKHHIVGSTDTGTGQHGRHSQRTGRHVDGDAVPFLHTTPP